jgi:phospholipid-binding lipoprotein MlaA
MRLLLALCIVLSSSAFAMENRDPWEPVNRKIFAFNDTADRYLLKPVAKGYQKITPDPVETGIRNFFSNVGEVPIIINDLLQLEFAEAGNDTGRFVINTTVGLAGIFDVASKMGLPKNTQDFGLTMAHWGVKSGPYVVVPFLGPFTVRDGFGAIVNSQADLLFNAVDHVPTRNTLWGTKLVDGRASLLAAESLISGDRYTFLRDVYLQQRDFLVNDGVVEDDFGDDALGEDDFEDWN